MSLAAIFPRTNERGERIEPYDEKDDKNDYFAHISFLSYFFVYTSMQNCMLKYDYVS